MAMENLTAGAVGVLEELNNPIGTERARAIAAETEIAENLAAEIARATATDTEMAGKISALGFTSMTLLANGNVEVDFGGD